MLNVSCQVTNTAAIADKGVADTPISTRSALPATNETPMHVGTGNECTAR
ncbi:hypothetical protein Acsp05_66770 [Actinokineospora sp. NBRC 105648]|nr:hypothetical protein Acsp05_66770 [Actinokineospora sp. NBRC 105648]